jgi:transposase
MAEERKPRRQFSSEDKAAAVKRHVQNSEPVSRICEDLGIGPNLFYRWQKEFFDHAAAAFEVKGDGKRESARLRDLKRENEKLRTKLGHKDNVIAEITEDYVKLKKTVGED